MKPEISEVRGGARAVELLHLAFLQVLASQVDPARYVVKGGANLRLFAGSPRRSQDIDLDILPGWNVEDRVDAVLSSRALSDLLRRADIQMSAPSKPKQTDTTKRWKFAVTGPAGYLNSKIEFSARGDIDPEYSLETIAPPVGRDIGLRAIRVQHYLAPAAIRQKIHALAQRLHTEPRDLFDLDLLLARSPRSLAPGSVATDLLQKAIEAAFSIPYAAYEALVVAYLDDEQVPIYGRQEVWEEMVLTVTGALASLK